jgi:hypothetical protein
MAEHTLTRFAHTNHEHASTSTQIVAKHQRLTRPFSSPEGKPSPPAQKLSDNLLRGGALTKIRMATWSGILKADVIILEIILGFERLL